MADMVMDPTWGALEDAMAPQRRETLARLLAGQRGIDPGSMPITGETGETGWSPGGPRQPGAAGAELTPARSVEVVEKALTVTKPRRGPMSVYDTPYGPALRQADEAVKKDFWGMGDAEKRFDRDLLTGMAESYAERADRMQQSGAGATPATIYETPYGEQIREAEARVKSAGYYQRGKRRADLARLSRLAENHLRRSEGLDELWNASDAADRRSQDALAEKVLESGDQEQASIRKERIANLLAQRHRFTRGPVVDRDEDGAFQEVLDNETGESKWEKIPVPPAKKKATAPAVHGLGAGGGVYFDAQGRPERIEPFRADRAAAPPKASDAVLRAVTEKMLEGVGPEDPEALARALTLLRNNFPGSVPGEATAGGPTPEEAAAATHGGPPRALVPPRPVISGRVGGPGRISGTPRTATHPKTGAQVVWTGREWAPVR